MLNDDEQREIRSLNARLYGPDGGAISDEELARLEQLERQRTVVDDRGPIAEETGDDTALTASNSNPGSETTPPPATDRRRASLTTLVLLVSAALILVLLGGWSAASMLPARNHSTASTLPELMRPATDEDVIDVADADLDSSSIRYIATVDGYRVFLGRSSDHSLVCVLTMAAHSDDKSTGCSGWNGQGGGFASSADSHLTIAVGDVDGLDIQGNPTRLSESVTAFREPRS